MKEARIWHGYAQPLRQGGVVLDPEAAAAVLSVLRTHAAAEGPRNGLAGGQVGSPIVAEVLAACEVSERRMSASGPVLRTSEVEQATSSPDDLLTTADVAEELNVTERHARRLACRGQLGDVEYAGRVIQVRRFEVDAYRARRAAA